MKYLPYRSLACWSCWVSFSWRRYSEVCGDGDWPLVTVWSPWSRRCVDWTAACCWVSFSWRWYSEVCGDGDQTITIIRLKLKVYQEQFVVLLIVQQDCNHLIHRPIFPRLLRSIHDCKINTCSIIMSYYETLNRTGQVWLLTKRILQHYITIHTVICITIQEWSEICTTTKHSHR